MDERAKRIFGLIQGSYDLSKVQIEESGIVKNEFSEGKFCCGESEKGYHARLRILEKLNGGKDDEDLDIVIQTNAVIEEYIACKMYEYACYFQKQDILHNIFSLMAKYRKQAEICGDLGVQMEYTYEADGLMAAVALITQADIEDLEEIYNTYVHDEKQKREKMNG